MTSAWVDLGGPLHYRDFGGEGPTVVLVHGLGGSHANWLAVGERLARRHRVLAPDLAGFGHTPVARRGSRVPDNRALLDRFVREVAGAPAILVGNSMGGLLSVLEAAERPDAVAGLVLVGAALPAPRGTPLDPATVKLFAAYMVPYLAESFLKRRQAELGSERLVRELLKYCTVDLARVPAEVIDAHVELARAREAMPWAHPAFVSAARSVVLAVARRAYCADAIRKVRAPALIIHGDRDRLVPVASARETARLRPDWKLEVFEGFGHVPQLEAPERFVAVVESWLDNEGRRAAEAASRPPRARSA